MDAEIEFKSAADRDAFKERCKSPRFVAECLKKYQMWRKGIGEYSYSENPERSRPFPFSAEALSVVEDSAIEILESCGVEMDADMPTTKHDEAEGALHG
jgi:hypothetical protein